MIKTALVSTALLAITASPSLAQRMLPDVDRPVVQLVQSDSSFRVNQLEEEVRRLNGKVEELNFLLLQLQEKLRKMEEDNEIRFQEIEEKQSDAGDSAGEKTEDVARDEGGNDRLEKPEPSEPDTASDEKNAPSQTTAETAPVQPKKPAKPRDLKPRALGTLTFDADGNVIDARPEDQQIAGLPEDTVIDEALDASEFGATPDEVFAKGKKALDSRNYETARRALSAHRAAWPKDPAAGQVLHYLGKAQFWKKNYFEAANAHLEAHKNYPETPTAPDNLLGLGLALAGLNQREVACATYAEVIKQYPEAQARLGERVKDEQASAKC